MPHGGRRAAGGSRRRVSAAQLRRARLTYIWGAAAVVVAIIVAVTLLEKSPPPKARPEANSLVTTFQPGEFRTAPDACSAVSSATLTTYLPGKPKKVRPASLDGRASSGCDWTVDNPPLYRALDVGAQAYAPSSLATGDGSATNAAIDAYTQDMSAKADPPKATHLPKSQIVRLSGLGTAAFAALEVVRAGGETSDIVTVVVRDRNVVVSVALQGVDHARGRTAYGPVSMSSLQAGATAAAHDVVSQLK